MGYDYVVGDEDVLVGRLGPLFSEFTDPMDVQVPLDRDAGWKYVRHDLQLVGNRLLRLELNEDEKISARVSLLELGQFTVPGSVPIRPDADEDTLWARVAAHPDVPPAMEVIVRDLLLTTGVDSSPANAERIAQEYRRISQSSDKGLHVALAILRANTVARSRKMTVEGAIRGDLLLLAERALTSPVLPGISLRHIGALIEAPRTGPRPADELSRALAVLDHVETQNADESTFDWVAKYRISAADTDAGRDAARRLHVGRFIALSADEEHPFRAMHWAEKAVNLAADYGIEDLHDVAVVRMQKLSRTDLRWERRIAQTTVPVALLRQRQRLSARWSSWEQALAIFLATESPAGSIERHKEAAAKARPRLLDLITGRTFGSHQLPERTHGSAEEEHLRREVQVRLAIAARTLAIDLSAVSKRFHTPTENQIINYLSTIYGSAPELVRPFAIALRLYWTGDYSGAARVAIPLVEAGARELLFLMDQPLYRMERGATPGRFPAMDFYLDRLEEVGFDPDWATAMRGTLLSTGMNLRNRLAHGFQFEFTEPETALVMRLAGVFIGMPVGLDAITDERVRSPLARPRKRLRRRVGWVWR